MIQKRNLTDHFIVLTPTLGAEPVEGTENREKLPWENR